MKFLLELPIQVSQLRLSGKPVVTGTRVSAAQIFAEIAEGRSIQDIADDMDIPEDKLSKIFKALASQFEKPENLARFVSF